MFFRCLLHLVLEVEFKPLSCYILKIDCCKHDLSVFVWEVWCVEKEVEFQLRDKHLELLSFSVKKIWFSHFSLLG